MNSFLVILTKFKHEIVKTEPIYMEAIDRLLNPLFGIENQLKIAEVID